jgi:hypothetical protein
MLELYDRDKSISWAAQCIPTILDTIVFHQPISTASGCAPVTSWKNNLKSQVGLESLQMSEKE